MLPGLLAQAGEREKERERDGVRVEVPEAEREERPFRDRVLDAPRGRPPVEIRKRLVAERLVVVETVGRDLGLGREVRRPDRLSPARHLRWPRCRSRIRFDDCGPSIGR